MRPYFSWRDGVRHFTTAAGQTRRACSQLRSRHDRDEPGLPAPVKTINNPYYIGGRALLVPREQTTYCDAKPRYAKHTLQEAVDEATRRLAADPRLQEVSVVKIVRVVRRAKPVISVDIEVVE